MSGFPPQASAPQLCRSQRFPLANTYRHDERAWYREVIPMGHPSMNYGSSSQQPVHIPRRGPTRNQLPGSTLGPLRPVQIDGPRVQGRLYRGSQPAAYPPQGALMVAPGVNPYGPQKPGVMAVPSPHHGTHHYPNRSRGPYLPHIPPRQKENAGNQREGVHSEPFHQWSGLPSRPVPPNTNFGPIFPPAPWQSQEIAPLQGPQAVVAPTFIGGTTAMVPETTPPVFFQGTQPTGAPTRCTEASPEVPHSTMVTCPYLACTLPRNCGRQQELERHVLGGHLPRYIHCPHPRCGWRGSRRYALRDHWSRKHPRDQAPDLLSSNAFTIYDAKRLAKLLVNREITPMQAEDEADASVRRKAVELKKQDMWNVR